MTLPLFPHLSTPHLGEVVTDVERFRMHLCDDVVRCPHGRACMQQPVDPDAICLAFVHGCHPLDLDREAGG